MHPILHHWPRLRLFLLAWLPLGAAAGLGPFLAAGGAGHDWVPVALWGELFATPALASWYLVRYTPPGAGIGTLAWRVGGGAVTTASLWAAAGWAWFQLWAPVAPTPAARFTHFAPLAMGAVAVLFVSVSALHYALVAVDGRAEAMRRAHDAEVGARDAELRALRAQVNPHFLFNCLHSISALCGHDPESARRMCQQLADFFRDSLRAGSERLVPLATEVALVRQYLDIERVRFGERLQTEIAVTDDAEAIRVPPLLLQPLIENAIRHGIATLVEGGDIRLQIRADGGRASAVVDNACDPDGRRGGTGIGLANVRARLHAVYGDQATLTAGATGTRYRVELSWPTEATS